MHVTVELEGSPPCWPRGDFESNCLAAFLVMVDLFMATGITQRSFPELLDPPQNWDLYVGIGLPRPDDPEVQEAVSALAQWAATQREASPLIPFQRFAFESPSPDEDLEVRQKSAWQDSDAVASACRALHEAIHAKPGLQVLDRKFPFLASPAASPNAPKSNLDALREIAFGASGRRLRLLLTT